MGKDGIELVGIVVDCYPSNFKVKCENGHEVLAYLSGKIKKNYIRVIPGDKVIVEVSPYDLTRGRIVKRVTERSPSDLPPAA